MSQKPIIIVGAGPTGLTAANILGQQGIPTIIIEEDATLTAQPKAVLLDDNSFRVLQMIGLSDEMQKHAIMGYGSRYINVQGSAFMEIGCEVSANGYPKRNSFSQPKLEEVLFQGLDRWESVTIHMQTKAVSIKQTQDGVSVACETHKGEKVNFDGCVLLACDGGSSPIRHLLNIKMEGPHVEQDWLVLDTENDPDTDRFTKFWCSHTMPGLSIPQPNSGRRYEYLLREDEDREKVVTYEAVKKRLAPHRDLKEKDLERASVYTFHALVAEKIVDRRVLLLGDAAHLTPPFAGQGLNAGIRDAVSVCWRAVMLYSGCASVNFLNSYHNERHEQMRDMINFALNLGMIMMPNTEFEEQVTERIFTLIGLIPEAKDYIYNMRFKPKMHLRAGFKMATPGLSFEDDQCGKKLPQPQVTCRDGSVVLLDELLGAGFSRIGVGMETGGLMLQFEDLPRGPFELARVVLLLPHEAFPEESGSGIIYAKVSESILISKDYVYLPRPHTICLVRPDRYCAAVISVENLALVGPQVKRLFESLQD